ncbi:dUTP diphosphatase [Aquibacillus sp. 3ASR75-11]|uniref:dUTP diphosphatase n=1 Tax=Terrihalobacillus insolitus TaxID=2950438 RepID=A0A9X3WV94_9BACI|nr:dUTP diphosphatase [Terrihalobacillus insolitus]MDC3412598.1 dUTP diphosphatase [Terrihalobacillus insolitus]MDC3423949.1 dUTP diphosphatase [Terrihalobacillus insolitus]
MDWNHLFTMQKKLDAYILSKHQLDGSDLFDKKVLALFVEVGELANETRCFKFWSTKPKSESDVILEEYVDGLHFILSLGIEKGLTYHSIPINLQSADPTVLFNQVFEKTLAFKNTPSKETYVQLFTKYIQLGESLGFGERDIQQAYMEKNQVNHERQDQGY